VPSEDLLAAPAIELARLIREGVASSAEVVGTHLDRIAEVNPVLNAVVQFAPDALRRAAAADEAVARGDAVGPLHGVPFTVKNWIEVEGLVCAAGFEERVDFVPRRDAAVVARMRDAGAILLGKTNVTHGEPVYARPNNPHELDRVPGGDPPAAKPRSSPPVDRRSASRVTPAAASAGLRIAPVWSDSSPRPASCRTPGTSRASVTSPTHARRSGRSPAPRATSNRCYA